MSLDRSTRISMFAVCWRNDIDKEFNVQFDDSTMRDNEVGVTPATCSPSLFGGGFEEGAT